MTRRGQVLCCAIAVTLASVPARSLQESKPVELRTPTYATRDGVNLLLDLYQGFVASAFRRKSIA